MELHHTPKGIGEVVKFIYLHALSTPLQHQGAVYSAQFSMDGQRVLTTSADNKARVWDARTGMPLTDSLPHSSEEGSAHLSSNGLQVVTASYNTVRVWDVLSGRPLTEPFKDENKVWSAQFSANGLRAVTVSGSDPRKPCDARIWDAQTGLPITGPLKHEGSIRSIQFSPDGQRMLTASSDMMARIWDARTGQLLTEPLKHGALVIFAQFSPDGLRTVTTSWDCTARVWDTQTGQALPGPLKHEGAVMYGQFSPDGNRVVTASYDRTARIWDAGTGQLLTEPLKHEATVLSAQFSPDGNRVVSSSMDGTARVWEWPLYPALIPSWLADLAEAIGGRHLDEQDVSEQTASENYFDIKKRVENDPSTNAYIIWGKWFFADRSTRTISPFSAIPIPLHIQFLINSGGLTDLQEAARLAPTNGLVLARLALAVLHQDPKNTSNRIQEASSYCFAALHWAPDLLEVWLAKAQLCRKIGPSREALEFIRKAALRFPQEPAIWECQGYLLSAIKRWSEAVHAYTKAIELTAGETGEISLLRKNAFDGRAGAHLSMGNTNEARADLEEGQVPEGKIEIKY